MRTTDGSAVVRIPRRLDEQLTELAIRTGRSKIYYLKEALTNYLEDLEDNLLADAAEYEMRGEKWLSHEDIKKKLGLDN